ncbi:MAG: Calx-beta domain-containing protein [Planctomycetaceae bacterium]
MIGSTANVADGVSGLRVLDVNFTSRATGTIQNDDSATLSISNVSMPEGNSGITTFTFDVTLDAAAANDVTFDFATVADTATEGSDFTAATGSGTITAGSTSTTITVDVTGDTTVELDEQFFVDLSNLNAGGLSVQFPAAATTARGTGTIQNDETSLAIAATDADKVEGDSGLTAFTFTVTRTGSDVTSVDYAVSAAASDPANAEDFEGGVFATGTVAFSATDGATKVITVNVNGDIDFEANEGFVVTLSNPTGGATITTAEASGTIQNDEITPPNVTSPTGSSSERRPTITWDAYADATSYEVKLELLETDSDTVIFTDTTTSTSFALPAGVADLGIGRYRASVRATVPAGTTAWGTTRFDVSLATAVTGLPFRGSDRTPEITWTQVPGATGYRVHLRNSTAGTAVVSEAVSGTSFTPTSDLEFGVHQIWVQPIGPKNYPAQWSLVEKYYIGPSLLTQTVDTFDRRPTFSWTSMPDIDSYRLFVRVGSTVVIDEPGITGTSFTPTADLPVGNVRWWIQPTHTSGRTGAWSLSGTYFSYGRPTVTGPTGTTTESRPSITWNPVEGAGTYEVYLLNTDGAGLQQRIAGVTGTSLMSVPVPNGNYRVWTKAWKSDGTPGFWSRPFNFVVNAANTGPAITSVVGDRSTFDTTPTLSWTATGASSFELYLTNGTEERTETVTTTSWTPATPLTEGIWSWWVQAKDSSGTAGRWSARQTVDVSGRPVILGPTGSTTDTTPTITWTAVTGASRYSFVLDNLTTGQESIIRDDNVSGNSFTTTTLATGTYRAWVRAVNADTSQPGPWSLNVQFVVADLQNSEESAIPDSFLVRLGEELLTPEKAAEATPSPGVVSQSEVEVRTVRPVASADDVSAVHKSAETLSDAEIDRLMEQAELMDVLLT